MKVITNHIDLSTKGNGDVIDITDKVAESLRVTLLQEGNVTIFIPGSTAGISTLEHESGLVRDIRNVFDRLIPEGDTYHHNEKWHDGNGHAHIRSALVKTSLVVPFKQANLLLGTWQQIVFIEFDNRPRQRKVIVQFIGV